MSSVDLNRQAETVYQDSEEPGDLGAHCWGTHGKNKPLKPNYRDIYRAHYSEVHGRRYDHWLWRLPLHTCNKFREVLDSVILLVAYCSFRFDAGPWLGMRQPTNQIKHLIGGCLSRDSAVPRRDWLVGVTWHKRGDLIGWLVCRCHAQIDRKVAAVSARGG